MYHETSCSASALLRNTTYPFFKQPVTVQIYACLVLIVKYENIKSSQKRHSQLTPLCGTCPDLALFPEFLGVADENVTTALPEEYPMAGYEAEPPFKTPSAAPEMRSTTMCIRQWLS